MLLVKRAEKREEKGDREVVENTPKNWEAPYQKGRLVRYGDSKQNSLRRFSPL